MQRRNSYFSNNVKWLALAVGSLLILLLIIAAVIPLSAYRKQVEVSEHEAIKYKSGTPVNSITRLQADINSGKVHLQRAGRQGVLASILKNLSISIDSQLLVFSKTSFQRDIISPKNPRSLFFNDTTYIGWVPGGSYIEIATIDPVLGMVFYTADPDGDASTLTRTSFKRATDECLECHETGMSNGVPGNIFRSVYTHPDGQPEFSAGSYLTDDSSILNERWGGWYVTGKHGSMRHMGNTFAYGMGDSLTIDRNTGANLTSLTNFIDTSHYLANTSDIVALMVAEHQTHIQNLIIKASYGVRIAEWYDKMLNRDLNRPLEYHSDSSVSRITSECEPLIRAMLFSEEAPLESPVSGASTFYAQFQNRGPFDSRHRSLRQLDLKQRLMRYRCSYLIYSEAFKALPDRAKNYIYVRLSQILNGKDTSKIYASITAAKDERMAILEILRDTDTEFASFLKSNSSKIGEGSIQTKQ